MAEMEQTRPSISVTQSLIRSLVRQIDLSKQASSHLPATDRFLTFIRDHLLWYGRLLHEGYRRQADEMTESAQRAEFLVEPSRLLRADSMVREAVFELIPLIKSLCEGTTDSMPYAIAGWIDQEFGRIRDSLNECKTTGVALCPVLDVNFFYANLGEVSELFQTVDTLLCSLLRSVLEFAGTEPEQEESLPFYIGFQYSMDEDVLFNAILFHELGHHIAKEIELQESFEPELNEELHRRFKERWKKYERLSNSASEDDEVERETLFEEHMNSLLHWVEELFCDAFGLLIAGPQMAFALRDLSEPIANEKAFSDTHPADLFRLKFQWDLLNDSGWLPGPDQVSSDFQAQAAMVLRSLDPGAIPAASEWQWGWEEGEQVSEPDVIAIELLVESCPDIVAKAREYAIDAEERAVEFWKYGSLISEAFYRQIVPSTLVVDEAWQEPGQDQKDVPSSGEAKKVLHPHPASLITVTRVIFERGCEGLIRSWPEVNLKDVKYDQQQHLERRLTAWTQKAITDWLLF